MNEQMTYLWIKKQMAKVLHFSCMASVHENKKVYRKKRGAFYSRSWIPATILIVSCHITFINRWHDRLDIRMLFITFCICQEVVFFCLRDSIHTYGHGFSICEKYSDEFFSPPTRLSLTEHVWGRKITLFTLFQITGHALATYPSGCALSAHVDFRCIHRLQIHRWIYF